MRLVVDASTLVGEMLRDRGLALLASPRLDPCVPARMWDEARHELSRRLGARVSRGNFTEAASRRYWTAAMEIKDQNITEAPEEFYAHLRDEALSRVPQDPDDWQVAALALSLDADILAEDRDFFGCGVATWTVETLIPQLVRRGAPPFQS